MGAFVFGVITALGYNLVLGLLLAAFDIVIAAPLIERVLRGRQGLSMPATERLVTAVNSFEADWVRDTKIRVGVQDDLPRACQLRHNPPWIMCAESFVAQC